jgi:uncharacterized protein (TIGR02679 family)
VNTTLDTWAKLPGPAKVLAAARLLYENGRTGPRVTVRVDLDTLQRHQVAKLLGMAWDTTGDPVRLGALDTKLKQAGTSLAGLLVTIGGPLRDRPAEKAAAAEAARTAVDDAYRQLTDAGVPTHAVSLARSRRWLDKAGLPIPGRAAALAQLWQTLPAAGRPLPELANQLFGDPHALDRDADLGRAAARLLAAAADPTNGSAAADQALTAGQWRTVWAGHGVACDEVSSTVLVLNLPLDGSSPAAVIATAAADCGEPVWLTARSLRGPVRPLSPDQAVRVCENPAIVETAAARYGSNSQPLICIYGRPSVAAWTLLHALAAAGTRLLVTADRDTAGRQFLTEMLALPTAEEWLPDADGTYEEARLEQLVGDVAHPAPSTAAAAPSTGRQR